MSQMTSIVNCPTCSQLVEVVAPHHSREVQWAAAHEKARMAHAHAAVRLRCRGCGQSMVVSFRYTKTIWEKFAGLG